MINDQKLLKFIDHVETRLDQIAGYTKPNVDIAFKVDNPAIVNGELLTHNQKLRHQRKPYDRVKAAESDLIAAQKKLAVKQKRVEDAQVGLREAEQKVRDAASNLANERKFHDFINLGR